MKTTHFLCIMLFAFQLLSCNGKGDFTTKHEVVQTQHHVKIGLSEKEDSILISSDDSYSYNYSISINNTKISSGHFINNKKINILDRLKTSQKDPKILALEATKSNGKLNINVTIPNHVDTIISYKLPCDVTTTASVQFTGLGAPLVNTSSSNDDIVELRKWLFNKKEYMPDSLVNKLSAYYRTLTKTEFDEYRPKTTIPVLHTINGSKYKIKADLKADYYALVACLNQNFIDKFVENIVGNNFDGVANSLSQALVCHQQQEQCGYMCLVLIGINKDWSYTQKPIGIVAIDNAGPQTLTHIANDSSTDLIELKDKQRVILPDEKPIIHGFANVEVSHWDGNGSVCNVSFIVRYHGDVKSITIKRRGNLCDSWFLEPEDKIIYTKDHESPYSFTYKLHFDNGDNIIPVVIADHHGNITNSEITIRAKFVRTNVPSINIDNNIDINNY